MDAPVVDLFNNVQLLAMQVVNVKVLVTIYWSKYAHQRLLSYCQKYNLLKMSFLGEKNSANLG
jgi:hypothetical protein